MIQRQIRLANKPKKAQPTQGKRDSVLSRGSTSNLNPTDNGSSFISQVLDQPGQSGRRLQGGAGRFGGAEESFTYEPGSLKHTAETGLDGYATALDQAGAPGAGGRSRKGSIINKNQDRTGKPCCSPCTTF